MFYHYVQTFLGVKAFVKGRIITGKLGLGRPLRRKHKALIILRGLFLGCKRKCQKQGE
jgi:hypothetical protein